MMYDKKSLLLILAAIFGAGYYYYRYYSVAPQATETFVNTGGMQNLGSVEYSNPVEYIPSQDSQERLEAPDFAQLVDDSNRYEESANDEVMKPFERLDALADSYIPKIASRSLPFSQAAAKPLVSSYSVNLPRVNLKGKLYEMNLSSAIRGSSAIINYDPSISVVAKSRYGPSDSYNAGLFTPGYDSMYKKLSGSYRNIPQFNSGAGNNGQIELIMDQ